VKPAHALAFGTALLLSVPPAHAGAPFQCDTVRRLEERGTTQCGLELSNRVESEHFSVEWGPAGGTSIATAEYLLDGLEATRTVFLDGGYAEPAGNSDGYRVPFYLGNSGGGAPTINFNGGYTTVCSDFEHAYVVMSSIEQTIGTLDVANHELFHAVQMGSPNPYSVEGFYWEASATWAEEFAEPTFNQYQWFLPAYTNHTNWAIDHQDSSQDGFLHRYAMFILPMYLYESSPSGPEVLQRVWNGSGSGLVERLDTAWRDFAHDTTFKEQFGAFTAHVSTMDFVDGDLYDFAPVPPREVFEGDAELTDVIAPRWFGAHFYRVRLDEDDREAGRTKLRVSFDGTDSGWVVAINRSPDGREAIPTMVLADEDGVASVSVIDVGTLYDETWVIVTSTQTEAPNYDLTITFVDQTEEPGSDIEPDDNDDDNDRHRRGTGCQGVSSHPFGYRGVGALALVFLVPLLRRRP
jgi:hypothetical protein